MTPSRRHSPARRARPARWAGLLALLWLGLAATPAVAHARLVASDPAAGSTLTVAPTAVVLTFDEDVSIQFSEISVVNRARQEVSSGTATPPAGSNAQLQIALAPTLANGTYTVLWRAVSAVDGHVTQGNFAFILQQPGGAPEVAAPAETPAAAGVAGGTEETPPPPPLRWLWRALALIAAAGLLGAPLFSSLILPAVVAEHRLPAVRLGRRLAALVVTLSLLVLAALAADMLYQVAALDGSTPLTALGDLALVPQVVATTGYGIYWAVKVVAALALLTYALWRRRTPAPPEWPAAVLNAGFLFAAEALGSHGGAAPAVAGLPLGTAIDLLHLLTAGAWIGGLLYLAAVLLPVLRRMDPAAARAALGRIIPRFSRLALFSAGLLFVTGLGNLALHTLDPAAVLDSDYGRIVALKHLLFLPLLTLAALSNRLVQPHVPALLAVEAPGADAAWPRALVGAVRAQAALGLLVLLLAAGLTLLPPPAAPGSPAAPVESAGVAAPAALPVPASASGAQTSGGVRFDLTAYPAAGGDRFGVAVTRVDPATPPLTDVFKLQVQVMPQDVDAGSSSLVVTGGGAADPDRQVYTATGQVLTVAGAYQVNLDLLRLAGPDLQAGFLLTLGADGGVSLAGSPVVHAIVTTRPNPPQIGPVRVDVRLVDGAQQPLPEAAVQIRPRPPDGSPGAPAAGRPAPGTPGLYQTNLDFRTPGLWLLIIEVDRPGRPPIRVDSSFAVLDPRTPSAAGQ